MNLHSLWTTALAVTTLFASLGTTSAGLIGNRFDGNIYSVNTTTGAGTFLSGTGVRSLAGIAFQPGTSVLFGLTTFGGIPASSLVTINPLTGAVTTVGNTGMEPSEGDLAFNPTNGFLYGLQGLNKTLFQINPLTGVGTALGIVGTGDYSALAFDSAGTLYSIDTASNLLLTLNPANGSVLTSVPTSVNLNVVAGLAFEPLTGTAYVADGGSFGHQLYTLDTTSGVLTSVGSLGIAEGLAGLAFEPVPEPTTALFGLALVGFCTTARRRRAQAQA